MHRILILPNPEIDAVNPIPTAPESPASVTATAEAIRNVDTCEQEQTDAACGESAPHESIELSHVRGGSTCCGGCS